MKILIAVEENKFGTAMADFVAEHEWPEGSEIRLIHALEPIHVNVLSGYPSELMHNITEERQRAARSLLLSVGSQISMRLAGVPVIEQVIDGHPKDVIIDAANDWPADLIVLGSHGRTGLGKFLLGSVSMSVVSAANCSVVVVKLPPKTEDKEKASEETARKETENTSKNALSMK